MIDHACLRNVSIPNRPVVLRRAQWLLDEARQSDAKNDQVIKHLMRVLSSYVTLGRDYKSKEIKRVNKRVSVEAGKLLGTVPFDEWHAATVNDHEKRVEEMWHDVRAFSATWTVIDVLRQFIDWPMTTILKNPENKNVSAHNRAPFAERYLRAGIRVIVLEEPPLPFR